MNSILTYIFVAIGASIILSNFTAYPFESAKSQPEYKTTISFWLIATLHLIISSPLLILFGIATAIGWFFTKLPRHLQETLSITLTTALGLCVLAAVAIPLLIFFIFLTWG